MGREDVLGQSRQGIPSKNTAGSVKFYPPPPPHLHLKKEMMSSINEYNQHSPGGVKSSFSVVLQYQVYSVAVYTQIPPHPVHV